MRWGFCGRRKSRNAKRLTDQQRSMPICISCSTPVKNLYTTYSKADDRSLGKGVRLTQCPRCKRFADKYVEHDFIVLFIDLVLIKPQVREPPMPMSFGIGRERFG
jgi:hypothetical protein